MEELVNKLIEKIENDTIQHYDFNEVLDMLKDLLVSNQEFYCQNRGYNTDKVCIKQCQTCSCIEFL